MELEEKKYWIWLSLLNLDIKKKHKILEIYKTPENIYKEKIENLKKLFFLTPKNINNIIELKNEELIYKHINYMQENNIDIINYIDLEYPKILKEIYDYPITLYIKGNKKILNGNNIGIVGCRECTEYGKTAAKYFSYNLSKEKINIVSGLAKGIDGYSHFGCLCSNKEKNNSGKTIAVVGNGLDIVYPKQNNELAQEILNNDGAIISEYPCGTKPIKMNFPARNRIISGISSGIVVIEAKEKSGTLITVDFALEQGKNVFVVPGNINSINSVGTNRLIKDGAMLVTSYKDILDSININ